MAGDEFAYSDVVARAFESRCVRFPLLTSKPILTGYRKDVKMVTIYGGYSG